MTRQEIRLQGLGGQGIITAGYLIGRAASLHDHKHAIMTEDYSPYVTGGWSRADLVISDESIDYPLVTRPNVLLAMSQDGLDDNWRATPVKATVIAEAGIVRADVVKDREVYAVPALGIAEELGNKVVANIVMLGFLTGKGRLVSCEAMEEAIVNRYPKAAELNRRAFERGKSLAGEARSP